MVDSGSFLHAIDGETDLPGHEIQWFTEEESLRGVAETACGGILRRLGSITTSGKVGDTGVNIQWNHMKVKCPILSVVRLAKDGNEVFIHKHGGEVVDTATGKQLRLFEHMGVYYMKIKLDVPNHPEICCPPNNKSQLFKRRGA